MNKIIIVDPNDKFTVDLDYAGFNNKSLAKELHKLYTTSDLAKHIPMGSKYYALLGEVWSRLNSYG